MLLPMKDNKNKHKNKNNVTSPCVRNCCLNKNDICLGCFRHVDEIIEWGAACEERRLSIIEVSKLRRAEHALKYPAY